jgi:hypothetical protein
VSFSRNNVLVPVPQVDSWSELQGCLEQYCRDYLSHKIQSRPASVGVMLAEEQTYLTPLPQISFDKDARVGYKSKTDSFFGYKIIHDDTGRTYHYSTRDI